MRFLVKFWFGTLGFGHLVYQCVQTAINSTAEFSPSTQQLPRHRMYRMELLHDQTRSLSCAIGTCSLPCIPGDLAHAPGDESTGMLFHVKQGTRGLFDLWVSTISSWFCCFLFILCYIKSLKLRWDRFALLILVILVALSWGFWSPLASRLVVMDPSLGDTRFFGLGWWLTDDQYWNHGIFLVNLWLIYGQ